MIYAVLNACTYTMPSRMLNELFDKFRIKTVPIGLAPLDSLGATHKWVEQLQGMHEYEAHQHVVTLLGAYNRAKAPFDIQRFHILAAIEHFGSKLQHGLITQFLKNHADFKFAGKSLWQEIVAFYWQLAQAYHDLTSAVLQQKKPIASVLPTLVLRAMHYQGKLIQWRYLRYELPTPQIWHTLHKLYRLAEQHGFATQSMVLKGSAYCSCEQAYARIMLLHLMRPIGLAPTEIELAAYWAWKWREAISLSKTLDPVEHTHYVTLADSLPPQALNGQTATGDTVRYWSINGVLALMQGIPPDANGHSRLIKLYGIPFLDSPDSLLQHIHNKLAKPLAPGQTLALAMPATVNVSYGRKNITEGLRDPRAGAPIAAHYQATGHPSEAYYRLNVTSNRFNREIRAHDLLISYDENMQQAQTLAAIRWLEESAGPTLTLGMERLGFSPRQVRLYPLQDAASTNPILGSANESGFAGIADSHGSTLVSFEPMQHRYYDMREGDYIYRIRIHTTLEQKPEWLRVQFVRLTRRLQTE